MLANLKDSNDEFGYTNPKALDYAVDLGVAMQLTNILRDVGEDLHKNRSYLPQTELKQFGVSEDDLVDHTRNDNFKKLMKFQINRARVYYQKVERGIKLLSKESRLPVYLAHYNYSGILSKIVKNDYNVFTHRAYLSTTEKFTILPQLVYRTKFIGN